MFTNKTRRLGKEKLKLAIEVIVSTAVAMQLYIQYRLIVIAFKNKF